MRHRRSSTGQRCHRPTWRSRTVRRWAYRKWDRSSARTFREAWAASDSKTASEGRSRWRPESTTPGRVQRSIAQSRPRTPCVSCQTHQNHHCKADVRRSIKLANLWGVVWFPKTIGWWMYDQQITYLSCNQRRTHMVRFLSCFSVKKLKKYKSVGVLVVCHFCRHCRDVTSDTCHGSTISSADCLGKINHAQKVGELYRSSDIGLKFIVR